MLFPSSSLSDIVNNVGDISSSPQVIPKLNAILNDSEGDIDEAIKLIKMDVYLNGQIIKYTNSSFYRRGVPVDSLEVAIQRMGFNHVHSLVMMAAAKSTFNRHMKAYQNVTHSLFDQAIACGELMSALATPLRLGDRYACFSIGLFHGIGKIVIDSYLSEKGILINNKGCVLLNMKEEVKLIGFDYAKVGAKLLRLWEFSDFIIFPIRHQFSEVAHHVENQTTSALSLAAYLAIEMPSDDYDAEVRLKEFTEKFPEIRKAIQIDEALLCSTLNEASRNFEQSMELIRQA